MTERVHNFVIKAFINDTSLVVPRQFDIGGVCVYVGFIILSLTYVLYKIVLAKELRLRRHGEPLLKGAVRWAAAAGDLNILNDLSFAPGFDVESDLDGFTALHAAAVGGKRDAVLWLCQRGANVHAVKNDQWGDTALHYAAAQGDMASAQVLLAYGADPTALNGFGSTPRELAQKRRRTELADFLAACSEEETKRPSVEELEGWQPVLTRNIDNSVEDVEAGNKTKGLTPEQNVAWRAAMARSHDGLGTEGTQQKPFTKLFRILAVLMQFIMLAYLAWRGVRSLIPEPVGQYVYCIIVYIAELSFLPLSFVFVLSLWSTIERPSRWVGDMLPEDELPHVDVYVVRYSESVDVLEPTVIAALNMNWPGDKLTVHILDDGAGKDVLKMVRRLRYQLTCMKREARLVYVARRRVHGVPHHAKAGNINHAILRSQGQGAFIMVLDTDMIAHPDFLQRTIGHFYHRGNEGSGGWVQKKRTAFIQTPQDFWNVPPSDPMVHCARFFYGPMLQGRDGVGATPCCGTGVVFNRTSLVSIGGQSYGSITEDYNTSMNLFASGFSSMFLNERLVYGMAPEGLIDVFKQRQRWAMGALQILFKDNPLSKPGLTVAQSLLMFEAGAYHFLAISSLILCIVPFLFIFADIPPITAWRLWEFALAFGSSYFMNRLTMWVAARGIKGADIELWRGWQMWIWMAPNHVISIWKVIKSETWLRMITGSKEIAFTVTSKDATSATTTNNSGEEEGDDAVPPPKRDLSALRKTLGVTWYFLIYYIVFVTAVLFTIIYDAISNVTNWIIVVDVSGLVWASLNCWLVWPPVSTLLPRVETAQGWRIQWEVLFSLGSGETRQSQPFGLSRLFSSMRMSTRRRASSRAFTLDPAITSPSPKTQPSLPSSPKVEGVPVSIPSKATASSASGTEKTSSLENPSSATIEEERNASNTASPTLLLTTPLNGKDQFGSNANIGRVAPPMRTAASLHASALVTGTLLPERRGFTTGESLVPSLLTLTISGELGPAPEGCHPYELIDLSQNINGTTTTTDIYRDKQKPAWVEATIHENASLHECGETVSDDGDLDGEISRQHSAQQINDNIIDDPSTQLALADVQHDGSSGGRRISSGAGFLRPHRSISGCSQLMTRYESNAWADLATFAALTGDFDGWTNLMNVASALSGHQYSTIQIEGNETSNNSGQAYEELSPRLTSKRGSSAPRGDVLSPYFSGSIPVITAISRPSPVRLQQLNRLLNQSIRLETALDEKHFQIEQPLDCDFVSPFAIAAASAAANMALQPSPFDQIVVPREGGLNMALSVAQERVRAVSLQLLDLASTLSADASAALRTGSVLVVPIIPASVFIHSIVAKPSFAGSHKSPRDFTYILVSVVLLVGLVAASIAEVYWRPDKATVHYRH
ncbi:hypothetical protein Ndes2526B_g07741 [Nannochloris sp. 'desiccata']